MITLGGVPLSTRRTVGWTLLAGVRPYVASFELPRARAHLLLERARGQYLGGLNQRRDRSGLRRAKHEARSTAGPLELAFAIEGKPHITVRNLYALSTFPGSDPHMIGVAVADQRWLWATRPFACDFNVPRRTGDRRILGAGDETNRVGLRPEVAPIADDRGHRAYSLLSDRTPWTAAQALREVLTSVAGADGFRISCDLTRTLPLENARIRGRGDRAVQAILQYLPGYSIYVDYDGIAVVYDTRDDSEQELLRRYRHVGGGDAVVVDRSYVRPAAWDIYFEQEVELRFDYNEDAQDRTEVRGREELRLENVAPSPDYTLSVGGRTVVQGQWEKLGDTTPAGNGLLSAWDASDRAIPIPLTQDRIRKMFFPGHRRCLAFYSRDANGNPDAVWSRRIEVLLQHWRRTFRIPRAWADRLASVRPYRVALLDPETGVRAPATVYVDYVVRPTERGLIKRAAQETSKGWAVSSHASQLKDGSPAPFVVSLEDPDQMILSVTPRVDPWGMSQAVVPGRVDVFPTIDARKANIADEATWVSALWNAVEMAAGFDLSVILSAQLGGPNNLGRYHVHRVTTAEAAGLLGRTAGPARGPVRGILIGGGLSTARFGWADDKATQIKEACWTGGHMPIDLLVNPREIEAIARATAARELSTILDRTEGSFSTPLAPIVPTGSCNAVTHFASVVGNQAEAGTLLTFAPILEPIDVGAMLPKSVQDVVYRLVQP